MQLGQLWCLDATRSRTLLPQLLQDGLAMELAKRRGEGVGDGRVLEESEARRESLCPERLLDRIDRSVGGRHERQCHEEGGSVRVQGILGGERCGSIKLDQPAIGR